MKIAMFRQSNETAAALRPGLVVDSGVVDAAAVVGARPGDEPQDLSCVVVAIM